MRDTYLYILCVSPKFYNFSNLLVLGFFVLGGYSYVARLLYSENFRTNIFTVEDTVWIETYTYMRVYKFLVHFSLYTDIFKNKIHMYRASNS